MPDHLLIPAEVPVMTLSGAVLFPGVNMPLYIFEPRYKDMLADVLQGDRLFALATLDEQLVSEGDFFEPAFPVATVGVVRACQANGDGTSHLVIQGMERVRLVDVVAEEPYRRVQVEPLGGIPGAHPRTLRALRTKLEKVIEEYRGLSQSVPPEVHQYLRSIPDAELYCDTAAFHLLSECAQKLSLLETQDTAGRLRKLMAYLCQASERLRLRVSLQGGLGEDRISQN